MSSPFLTEYNEEKERRLARDEAAMLGRAEEKKRTVEAMLKRNYPLEAIIDISSLSAEAIRNIAQSLGIAVVS